MHHGFVVVDTNPKNVFYADDYGRVIELIMHGEVKH